MRKLPSVVIILTLLFSSFSFSLRASHAIDVELRGAWVATVKNIDWPSSPTIDVQEKVSEIDAIINRFAKLGINAVFLQVRPSYGTLYPSQIEPWSIYYTNNGSAETFDPLKYWIEQCHKNGIELHAWINPYRTLFSPSEEEEKQFLSRQTHPEWFIHYGKHLYMDPAYPSTRAYVLSIIQEIVINYNVDGIHFDDYFYPYAVGKEIYNDDFSFSMYRGNYSNKGDWRRNNVDLLIEGVHNYLANNAPLVKFGVSPFGVWRNKSADPLGSNTQAGVSSYDDLYADVLYWSEKRWVDYLAPQLYWPIGFKVADYKVLANWWNDHVPFGDIYIGHSIYKFDESSPQQQWTNPKELKKQIALNRDLPRIKGNIFYNTSSIMNNALDVIGMCETDLYAKNALIPNMPWKVDSAPSEIPEIHERTVLYTPILSNRLNYEQKVGITLRWVIERNPRSFLISRQRTNKAGKAKGKEEIIAILPGDQMDYVDATAKRGRYYLYRMVAVGANSNYSDLVSSAIVRAK